MNKKTFKKLEYDKIIRLLENHASSVNGKFLCSRLLPMTDLESIQTAGAQTAAAFTRIVKKGRPSFSGAHGVEDSMKRLEIGGTLFTKELLRVCQLLETTEHAKRYGTHNTVDELPDCLDSYFHSLEPLSSLCNEIRRCILSENEISDEASAHLRQIRKQIAQMNDKVHSTLNALLHGSLRNYLQDPIVTMRDNRYCLPVKAEYRGQVEGMIHDQSSSGSTLFVEPMSVIRLNNELKELFAKEEEEIEVILGLLSESTSEHVDTIRSNHHILSELDFIFAKGSLALEMNATLPIFNDAKRIHIREGRHPLLDKKSVVPITVTLGDTFHLLMITGPNTGGKTVSLKTIGLFTLMGQAGLHIPALDRSELSIFDEVYADIGDEQSIEQSLSTFSSHMTNIVSFLKTVNANSLVLFDELGAGTDPTEGAALAIAILSYLHERDIRTVATTHYSELKTFALTTSGVENASCEFDVATLRPTYRLLVGIPGKSNAFAISSKLGLPAPIIEEAKKHLSEQSESFEDILSDLEAKRRSAEQEHLKIRAYRQEAEQAKQKLQDKESRIEAQKERLLREAKEEASRILQDAKNTADESIKSFRKFHEKHAPITEMEQERDKLREKLKKTSPTQNAVTRKPSRQHKASDFKLGESVHVLSLDLNGTVSSLPDSRGNLYVQMGILRSSVHMSDLELIEEPVSYSAKGIQKTSSGKMKMSKSMHVGPEINLLGKTVDEALVELDKYLDDAYIAHISPVRIVHGKGTGALRDAIHQYLKRQRHIDSYRLGAFGEGDAGVTIVEFK